MSERSNKIDNLRILLLQIRDDENVRHEEHVSFARYSGLQLQQIIVHNVFDQPDFNPEIVRGYDALFVGGASEASVLMPGHYSFLNNAQALLLHCIEHNVPVFASCFGFQLAAVALGAKVLHDAKDFEMGTIPISLTDAATDDPVYRGVVDQFLAVSVHQEKILKVPPGCTELAYTKQCCHSFKVDGTRFWAFQFHPEVGLDVLIKRLTIFRKKYTRDLDHLDNVLRNAQETHHSNALLRNFVVRVLLGQD